MYPFEFHTLWVLGILDGRVPRPAADVAIAMPRDWYLSAPTPQTVGARLASLERRGLVERERRTRGGALWQLSARGREVVSL